LIKHQKFDQIQPYFNPLKMETQTDRIQAEISYQTWRQLIDENHIHPCAPVKDGTTPWKFYHHFGLFFVTPNDQKIKLDFKSDIEPQEIQALREAFGFYFTGLSSP
jgi:hypothetical protein